MDFRGPPPLARGIRNELPGLFLDVFIFVIVYRSNRVLKTCVRTDMVGLITKQKKIFIHNIEAVC